MSTNVYLYCLDHDPYVGAVGEIEQHIGGKYSENIARFIADRERLAKVDLWGDELQGSDYYFERSAAIFFQMHPKCRVGVKDEYDRWHDFPGAHVPEEASWAAVMAEATSDLDFGDLPRDFRDRLLAWCEDVSRWKQVRG